MNPVKFGLMVREFPFLTEILSQSRLDADSVGHIDVARVDQNLLEVTPRWESHDCGMGDDFYKSRQFWIITSGGKTEKLQSAGFRSQVPHGIKTDLKAEVIGDQLFRMIHDIVYIVEVDSEDFADGEGMMTSVRVYKMGIFNWLVNWRIHRLHHPAA